MYNVLIAMDNRDIRSCAKSTLDSCFDNRVSIYQVNEGHRALELIQEKKVDLVIMDVLLLGLNGIEVAKQMTSSNNKAKIVLVETGFETKKYDYTGIENLKVVDQTHLMDELNICKIVREYSGLPFE